MPASLVVQACLPDGVGPGPVDVGLQWDEHALRHPAHIAGEHGFLDGAVRIDNVPTLGADELAVLKDAEPEVVCDFGLLVGLDVLELSLGVILHGLSCFSMGGGMNGLAGKVLQQFVGAGNDGLIHEERLDVAVRVQLENNLCRVVAVVRLRPLTEPEDVVGEWNVDNDRNDLARLRCFLGLHGVDQNRLTLAVDNLVARGELAIPWLTCRRWWRWWRGFLLLGQGLDLRCRHLPQHDGRLDLACILARGARGAVLGELAAGRGAGGPGVELALHLGFVVAVVARTPFLRDVDALGGALDQSQHGPPQGFLHVAARLRYLAQGTAVLDDFQGR